MLYLVVSGSTPDPCTRHDQTTRKSKPCCNCMACRLEFLKLRSAQDLRFFDGSGIIRTSNMAVFWEAVPCSLVETYRRFRGTVSIFTAQLPTGSHHTRHREDLKPHLVLGLAAYVMSHRDLQFITSKYAYGSHIFNLFFQFRALQICKAK